MVSDLTAYQTVQLPVSCGDLQGCSLSFCTNDFVGLEMVA